jgi:hypothetical protein
MEVSIAMWAFNSSKVHLVSVYFALIISYNLNMKTQDKKLLWGTRFIGKNNIEINPKRYCVRVLTGLG